ncbi:hypothetical protein BH11ARM2_BH11ARM2_37150 [soil metagenome]
MLSLLVPLVLHSPYTPKAGDAAFLYTHVVKREKFDSFVTEGFKGINRLENRLNPQNEAYQLEDASSWRVMGVVFTPKHENEESMRQKDEVKQELARLGTLRNAPLKVDRCFLDAIDFSARRPKIGDVVYVYIHTAKPGMFETLRRSFDVKVPARFKNGYPRFTIADPSKRRLLTYVFYPNQESADKIHRSPERGRIIASTGQYRSSYTVERFVLAGTR